MTSQKRQEAIPYVSILATPCIVTTFDKQYFNMKAEIRCSSHPATNQIQEERLAKKGSRAKSALVILYCLTVQERQREEEEG